MAWSDPRRRGASARAPAASPIVANGHAFTISRRDPREVVTAVDLGDGSVIWRQSYDAAFEKNPYAVTMAKGPNATPLFADGRLFTVGVSGIVAAWSADDGTALWRHDFSDIFDSSVLFCGTAASPVLANGLVVLQVGSDVHGGRVVALDPVDGDIRWTWEGPGPGYASPALIEIGGTATSSRPRSSRSSDSTRAPVPSCGPFRSPTSGTRIL